MLGKIVNIKQDHLDLIKSEIGYPVIPEVHLTDDEIKQYAVSRALFEYFLKFPLPEYEQRNQQSVEEIIKFPDDDTISVLHIGTSGKSGFGQRQGNNSDFWQVVRFNMQYTGGRARAGNRSYGGNPMNPNGLRYNYLQERQLIDSLTNSQETFRHIVDYGKREVRVYSSVVAMLDITWAKTSSDFNQVKPTQLLNVIKLASAHLLNHLANLGKMLNDSNADKQINVDTLKSDADKLKEEVMELWREFPDIIVARAT